jgi:hypothetical protein
MFSESVQAGRPTAKWRTPLNVLQSDRIAIHWRATIRYTCKPADPDLLDSVAMGFESKPDVGDVR